VVVVDDAAEVRAVVKRQLRLSRRFVVVGEGGSGHDAVVLAASHRPTIMVLDASMPDLDGLQALPRVLEASPRTKVVMLSGFGGPTLYAAAMAAGAADFVEKSSPLRELPERLMRVLRDDTTIAAPAPVEETDDTHAESVLAEHLERFRTVFDQAAIGMATMTLSGTVVRANAALIEMTGRAEGKLVGTRYAGMAGPDSAEAVQHAVSIAASGVVVDVEHSVATPGPAEWVHTTMAPVADSTGRPLYILAQAQDVTSRLETIEELRASEERFRLLVDSVRDYAIFMLDPGGHITTWNRGAERMKGYAAKEIIGQHFRVFYPPAAQLSRHPEHELEIAAAEGRYEEEGWRVRKDGSRFWANVVITALFNTDGTLAGFGKVTRDITERRRAEETREAAASELADANAQLRSAADQAAQFMAVTAHELQSPVAAVAGAADLLTEHWGGLDDDERADLLHTITRGTTRLRRLLEDLLLAARLEAGSFDVTIAETPLAVAIDEALTQLPGGPADTEVRCPPGATVAADPVRLVQMLTNLVTNARKHGKPPVVIAAAAGADMVEVRVLDEGPGVDEAVADRLFEKFVQAHGRPVPGTGLGLFIVRELARAQGGDAWYERDESGRPCFSFALPGRVLVG
jgi:PAS domain S-box-containing protein